MTAKRKFGDLERDLPQKVAVASDLFDAYLRERDVCAGCGQLFTGASNGAQTCAMHPYQHYNRGTNLVGRYSVAQPQPTACTICATFYLNTSHSTALAQLSHNRGCVKVDHSTSMAELLSRPFIALPLEQLPKLELFSIVRTAVQSSSFPLILHEMRLRCDILLIYKPRHLGKTLQIGYPGVERVYRKPIADIYDEMAKQFALPALYDEVAAARAANPLTRVTKQVEGNADARRKDALRLMTTRHVAFVQFFILSRIQQGTNGTVQMKLVDT
jgi:hypothetical protein